MVFITQVFSSHVNIILLQANMHINGYIGLARTKSYKRRRDLANDDGRKTILSKVEREDVRRRNENRNFRYWPFKNKPANPWWLEWRKSIAKALCIRRCGGSSIRAADNHQPASRRCLCLRDTGVSYFTSIFFSSHYPPSGIPRETRLPKFDANSPNSLLWNNTWGRY